MKKWYRSCVWMLLATAALQFTGCASQRTWLAGKFGRDTKDRELAEIDSKDKSKSSIAKKSSEKSSKDSKDSNSDSQIAKKSSTGKSSKSESSEIAKRDSSKREQPWDKELAEAKKVKSPRDTKDPFVADDNDLVAGTGAYGSKATGSKSKEESKTASVSKKSVPVDPFEDFTPERPIAQTSATKTSPSFDEVDDVVEEKVATTKKIVRETAKRAEDDLAELTELPDWATGSEVPATKQAIKKELAQKTNGIQRAAASQIDQTEESLDKQIAAIAVSSKKVTRDISEVRDELRETLKEPAPASPSPAVRSSAVALLSLCPDAQGELREQIRSLNTNDSEALKRGLHKIGRMGTDAEAAAPALEHLLTHKDGFVRVHAALALARMQKSPPGAVQTVADGLKSPDPGLRSFSAATLAEMGPQAGEALTKLAASLDDRDGYVRLHAAEVLIRYDEYSYRSLDTLLGCLNDKDENVRWLATYSLAELAPEAPEAVNALAKATRDPVLKVQTGAAYALGEIGPFAKNAAPSLHRLADETTHSELQSAIIYALQQIEQ